jgi:pimeloyl-ACP methyl ester carboxylesterase
MTRLAVALVLSVVTALPCWAASEPHIIVLPGIEGPSPCARGIVSGLSQSHPNATYEVYDWTTGHAYNMLYHVSAWKRNQIVADLLAQRIMTVQAEKPGRPIVLVGHSGGGAMSVVALERLPAGCRIQQAILLAPDISPGYNLTTALDRTEFGIDVFHSTLDCVILGAATVAVGTVDRVRMPAAGMVGFSTPRKGMDEGSAFLYSSKLHQHGYTPAMSLTGHFGGHFTCTLPEFVKSYVSPVIR